LVSDAEHIGEKYPFYNTYVNPDGDDEGKNKKLFYPSVSIYLSLENLDLDKSTSMGV